MCKKLAFRREGNIAIWEGNFPLGLNRKVAAFSEVKKVILVYLRNKLISFYIESMCSVSTNGCQRNSAIKVLNFFLCCVV